MRVGCSLVLIFLVMNAFADMRVEIGCRIPSDSASSTSSLEVILVQIDRFTVVTHVISVSYEMSMVYDVYVHAQTVQTGMCSNAHVLHRFIGISH